jgi:serine acetyltransferase
MNNNGYNGNSSLKRIGIELPYTVELGRRVIIEHQHGIVIHGYAVIGDDSIII